MARTPSPTASRPYIDAAPLEEQKYFLATQQVDEARHAVFFKRFMDEVVGARRRHDGRRAARPRSDQLTWGHRKVFGRSTGWPTSCAATDPAPARRRGDALPRHHRGHARPARAALHRELARGARHPPRLPRRASATSRSTSSGTSPSASSCSPTSTREDPRETQDAIVELIREVRPYTSAIAMPPDWDDAYYTSASASRSRSSAIEGTRSIELRLRAIGLRPRDDPALPDRRWTSRSRSAPSRARSCCAANLIGPGGPVVARPRGDRDDVRHAAPLGRPGAVRPGTMIQWDFTDARALAPALDNGAPRAAPGRAPHADLRAAAVASTTGPTSSPAARTRGRCCCGGGCGRRATCGCCWRCRRSSADVVAARGSPRPKQHHRGRGQPLALAEGANRPDFSSLSDENPGRFGRSPAHAPPPTPFPR